MVPTLVENSIFFCVLVLIIHMMHTIYGMCVSPSKKLELFRFFRAVRKSSYRLNSLILVAVFVGFVGTLLHVIKLDDDMPELVTTTICNVS